MSRYSFARRTVSTVNVAVSLQIGLTALSIGRGKGAFESPPNLLHEKETFDAPHYKFVQDYISSLYSNQSSHLQSRVGVKLAECATWEDPKSIFQGATEIQQAFRIPAQDTAKSPRCVNVEPKGQLIVLSYVLPYTKFNNQSLLVVSVEMKQMKASPEFNEFVITKMEEKWNGIPIFQSLLFWIVRRINGVAAFHFSSGLGW